VLDLGATVHRLWVTGGDGVRRNVVLGHASPQEYLASVDYVGGTVGRYANRIARGRFTLDGVTHQVATNEGDNVLHGGPEGFDRQLWEVDEHGHDHLVLRLVSPAGDQGFPGRVVALARFEVGGDAVRVRYEATCDEPTVVNVTSHAYLNLDGDGSGPIDRQLLQVHARHYLPTDDELIPLEVTPVEGTPFDLRMAVALGTLVQRTRGVDHDYVLDGDGLRQAAVLDSPGTRTRAELWTDQPGLQVYTGGGLDGSRRSTTGEPYLAHAGLALEPQLHPDTPNRPDFGSAVLRPGEVWASEIQWRFGPLDPLDGAADA
jgi:aldose 1-epimerase